LLTSTRSDMAGLIEEHKTLSTQMAATTARLQQIETTVRQANDRFAKFNESAALQKISKERDDAVTQAKQNNDQIRQLTLQLQKAGVYP
jgi:hypothetical protein